VESSSFVNTGAFQLLLLAAFLIPAILFLLTEYNILKRISKPNRSLAPGWVWLQIIPFLGQIWQFVVVIRIAGSIQNEWLSTGEDSVLGIAHEAVQDATRRKPTLLIGLIYCMLNVFVVFMNLFTRDTGDSFAMFLGVMALASIISWVIYWVRLAGWGRRLKQKMQPGL